MVSSDSSSQRMLALTKAALHGTILDENLFVGSRKSEWDELFKQCAAQGVMVLTLNGAMKLPKELQPPLSVKLPWIASVEAVKERYRHYLETAEELSARFRENNIRMLLIKGFALARLYPAPDSREFGDIDIFLCGKAEEGDALLERISGIPGLSTNKHTNFYYREITIENHHTFLTHEYLKSFKQVESLEQRLMEILTDAGVMEEPDFSESDQPDEALLFPPPDFDALFVTLHFIAHLLSETPIMLRHLCDLTVLFTAYKGKIDFSIYRNALSEAGLLKLADAFISLAVRYLDLNPEYAPPYVSDLSLENRLWNFLLHSEVPPLPKEKRNLYSVFIRKIKLLRAKYQTRYRISELIFPSRYGKRFFVSIFFHLRHPKTIKDIFRP